MEGRSRLRVRYVPSFRHMIAQPPTCLRARGPAARGALYQGRFWVGHGGGLSSCRVAARSLPPLA